MTVHTGTVHGRLIQLDDAPDLPDGQRVRVTVEPADDSPDDTCPDRTPATPAVGPPVEDWTAA
ncbi:hypothetical protein [Alienimonas californiensis]|uniref:Uncharacterized protein n=1 Tax=Alienimonas californiensis TaxID=2527989 RepID=A0A517P819_9PLAN|nr:hypothetical protein [Alienimonas californiensis]QDT15519.1 hypothetical protein CA12_16040 [Alienimonas californiensis]